MVDFIRKRFYLFALPFLVLLLPASSAGQLNAAADPPPGFMPPSPDLLARVARGEATLPEIITNPEMRRALGVDQPPALIQPSGSWRAIALLVHFTDNQAATGATYFDTLLFANSAGTMRDYYQEVSYGILDVVSVNLPSTIGWMTMPQTYAYYVNGDNGFGAYPQNARRLAEDAVWAADPFIDYAQYDNDGDGLVESLFVIHAGPGAELTGNVNHIWSHKWSMVNDPIVDGVKLNNYTMEPEFWVAPGDMTIGVYAHELAHAFGLPDLYDSDGSAYGIGDWGLMAGGSWNGVLGNSPAWLSAWSRAFLGFVTPTNVSANLTGVSIPAAETSQTVYRLWTGGAMGNEYFLVENRQPLGYDAALPGAGLLIWHIDDGKVSNTQECLQVDNWNCGTTHLWVALEQADGLLDLEVKNDQGDSGDPFPGSTNKTRFDFGTTPNSSSYAASSNTCVSVNNIGPSGATMTADLTVMCGTTGVLEGLVHLQGRAVHDGADVCAWDNGLMIDCVVTDPTGFYSMILPEGTYDLTVEMNRYLDGDKAGVTAVAGVTTTMSTLALKGGDANDDDTVNIQDLAFLGGRYQCNLGDPCYDAKADANDDGLINIQDLVLAGGNYLQSSPVAWP